MQNRSGRTRLLVAARDLREYLARRLERLPHCQQQVMQAYFRDEMKLEEIARLLGVDVEQTQQMWLHALRRTCADEVDRRKR